MLYSKKIRLVHASRLYELWTCRSYTCPRTVSSRLMFSTCTERVSTRALAYAINCVLSGHIITWLSEVINVLFNVECSCDCYAVDLVNFSEAPSTKGCQKYDFLGTVSFWLTINVFCIVGPRDVQKHA